MNRLSDAKKLIAPAVVFLLALLLLYRIMSGKEQERYTVTYLDLFDTVTEISGYAPNRNEFNDRAEEIYYSLLEYNELYDIYNDYDGINNIKTINDNAGKAPVQVDKRIIDMLLFGKEMYAETGGMTNIAMGTVLKLWHEAREDSIADPANAYLPDEESLKEAGQHININDVIIDEKNSTVYLRDSEMSLDVGAIAKGYAAERVAEEYREAGMEAVLLSIGGNVVAIGNKPDDTPYNVGVQDPDLNEGENGVIEALHIYGDEALVTSGDYQRYFEVDGKRYCHIVSPDTLYPAEGIRSVTVIAKDSAVADAFSTALFLMTYEEGKKAVIGREDMEAMWVLSDGSEHYTEGFEERL